MVEELTPDVDGDSIINRLGMGAGYLRCTGRNLEVEGSQDIHSQIQKVDREAIGGVQCP